MRNRNKLPHNIRSTSTPCSGTRHHLQPFCIRVNPRYTMASFCGVPLRRESSRIHEGAHHVASEGWGILRLTIHCMPIAGFRSRSCEYPMIRIVGSRTPKRNSRSEQSRPYICVTYERGRRTSVYQGDPSRHARGDPVIGYSQLPGSMHSYTVDVNGQMRYHVSFPKTTMALATNAGGGRWSL